MNGTNSRFLMRWPARRLKLGLGLVAFGLSSWLLAHNGTFSRGPAAKLRAPQPVRGQELVARGLAPEYTSFPSLPPTGRVSTPVQPKKDSKSSMNWVFGPSGPAPTYMFGQSSKTNPISVEQPRQQPSQQQPASSSISSAWSSVKNLVVGSSPPATAANSPSSSNPASSRPVSGFGMPAPSLSSVAPAPGATASMTTDSGIYTREPAYRWYGWGSTTPGTNPYAPRGQHPQGSTNWYVQSGATPGAFPAPPQPVQHAEYSPESPRYPGNPVFGPEVTAAPTLWMNAPSSSAPMYPTQPSHPTMSSVPPGVVMVPTPQLPPMTIIVPPQPQAQPTPVVTFSPVNGPTFSPAVVPTTSPTRAAPTVDVVPGLTPASKPNKEPLPSVPVPPRDLQNPRAEIDRTEGDLTLVQAKPTAPESVPVAPKWASVRAQSRTEPLVISRPATQSPSRQAPLKSAPLMPPMPDFGPSEAKASADLTSTPVKPPETSWTAAQAKEVRSPATDRPGPPPPSLAFRPSAVPAISGVTTNQPSAPENMAALPVERPTPANWQLSSKGGSPIQPVRAEVPSMPPPRINLEQQVRSAAGYAVKVLEVRQSTPGAVIISFTAYSESDARAAAEAISKLPTLKPFNVSFNARILGK